MFWKKNKDKDKEKKMFESPSEVRGSFRVYPSEENPILLKVGDTKLKAVDISAGVFHSITKISSWELHIPCK